MLKSNPSMVIVILAAGASKRMGTPKQLLKWGNKTLLEHAIHTALKLKSSEVIVVLGANYHLIKKEIEPYPVSIINNTQWDVGLGTSIAFASEYIKKSKLQIDAMLMTLADQPCIDDLFLERLVSEFKPNKNSIVATSYGEEKYGVPVVFDRSYLEELSAMDTDNGAKSLLKKYGSIVKAIAPNSENLDIDSKEDYNQLYHKYFN